MRHPNPYQIESLEGRRLLAADLANGVLTVTGTAKADGITVLVHGDGHMHVTVNGVEQEFDEADVAKVVINCGRGNDIVDATSMTIPVVAYGGDGNDSIYAGNGNDDVHGGAGDDILWTTGGRDRVYGDEGNDALAGGGSNDTLNGAAGDDRLDGGNGNDLLTGGDGTDRLNGQLGNDTLEGNAGRDFFAGGAGRDTFFDLTSNDRGNDRTSDDTPAVMGTPTFGTNSGTGAGSNVVIKTPTDDRTAIDDDTIPGNSNGD